MPMRFHTIENITTRIPVFPLSGVLLLPRSNLPLNIFEPRYLTMVDDAMRGTRLIGMIQPTVHEKTTHTPPLYGIGGVGYITSYNENDDARVHISLRGICRFSILEELAVTTPYRQVIADYAPHKSDLSPTEGDEVEAERGRLLDVLKGFLTVQRLQADWESMQRAPMESLVNAFSMMCPFEAKEKQALLEADTLAERARVLIALMEMAAAAPPEGTSAPMQ